ncbi:hypothetical protein GBA52_019320 [Prunus armeniaca]|nr:hypothetical protein GBA52_019320 [Prunus armeniaca]
MSLSTFHVLVSAAVACQENEFSNFPQAVLVDPHEIQSNVNPKGTRQIQGSSSTPNKELQKSQHFKALQKMVTKKVKELKPLSSVDTDETTRNLQIIQPHANMSQVSPKAKPPRSRTTLTGDFSVSFELPEDFPHDANAETLVQERSGTPHTLPQFSFSERLQGWRITRRKRVKGIYDMAERRMARSATLKRKSSDVDCGNNVSEEDMQRFDCGPKEDFVRLSPEAMEERVRKFLKEAYENLRNLKFVITEEESESEGTKRLRVTIAPPNVVSSNTPSREDEFSNPSTEFHQADPMNHKEVCNGSHVQMDGIIRASPLETTRVMRASADQSAHDLQAYMEEREAEGTKTKHVNVPSVALSPPNALPKIPSREGEPSNASMEFDQAYLLNHVELRNGSPVLMDGVHGANPLAATTVREREVYQSAHEAYMEECDLINEIPECSNYEDLVTSLALMRARMSSFDKIVLSIPSSFQMVPFEARVDRELHEQLYKKLKAIVSKSTQELRSRVLSKPVKEGTRSTTNGIIRAAPMNSYVAEDSLHNPMKMSGLRNSYIQWVCGWLQLVPREETFAASSSQRPPRQFSLAQRLEGWKILRKQRRTGRCDLYFTQQRSNMLLRSYVEVVNFILYEVYTPKPTPKRKLLESYEPAYKSCRIIRESYHISEEEVREFFRSSYENLLNYKEDPSPPTDAPPTTTSNPLEKHAENPDANTPVDNELIAPGLQIDLNLPAEEAEGGEEEALAE